MIRKGLQALILVVVIILILNTTIAPVALADPQITCSQVEPQDISQLFSRWNASLQSGHSEIQDYFDKFLALKPVGQIIESDVKIFCNVAIDSGIYTFALTQNGKINQVRARYSFVYQKINNDWLIVEHHSSFMPEKL
jgi:hypothetical protein